MHHTNHSLWSKQYQWRNIFWRQAPRIRFLLSRVVVCVAVFRSHLVRLEWVWWRFFSPFISLHLSDLFFWIILFFWDSQSSTQHVDVFISRNLIHSTNYKHESIYYKIWHEWKLFFLKLFPYSFKSKELNHFILKMRAIMFH